MLKFARLQDRLSVLLGAAPDRREAHLDELLRRDPAEATGYWLQLSVSIGIATLGLILSSSAVVIGAMLIAPLMTPIVGLAMGLAVGSPFLMLRSLGRVALSVVCAVGGSALLTHALPFNELTPEIAARTTPTALDLLTAAFCAIAGAYAAMRPASSAAVTAAGTSIGISLVPPLCVCGYGLGVQNLTVAAGAGLLFVANLSAIIVVGTVVFTLTGFNRVNVAERERTELERDEGAPIARAAAVGLSRLFASPGGFAMRLSLPFLLLALVYAPLRTALDEVAWQIRVRSRVHAVLDDPAKKLVEQRLRVEHGEVNLFVLLVGTGAEAEAVEAQLRRELAGMSEHAPQLDVLAIPDAAALSGLATSLRTERAVQRAPESPKPSPAELSGEVNAALRAALARHWPSQSLGAPVALWLDTAKGTQLQLAVAHVGPALEPAVQEMLERALSHELQQTVLLLDRPTSAAIDGLRDPADFARELARMVEVTRLVRGSALCVWEGPPRQLERLRPKAERELVRSTLRVAAESVPVRMLASSESEWRVFWSASGPCPEPASTPRLEPPGSGTVGADPSPARQRNDQTGQP